MRVQPPVINPRLSSVFFLSLGWQHNARMKLMVFIVLFGYMIRREDSIQLEIILVFRLSLRSKETVGSVGKQTKYGDGSKPIIVLPYLGELTSISQLFYPFIPF
jgi:hypothetical protein